MKWLEVVVHDLQATCREQLALQELERAQARLRLVEAELSCVQSGHPPTSCAATDSPTATASGDHGLAAVQRGLDCISRQFHRPLQLADVAAELHLNASYFSRLFAQNTGVTFHHYLNEVRLSRAKELLRDPSQRVCEVACAVGFASADSFRRAFLHRFGVAPNHWRAAQ